MKKRKSRSRKTKLEEQNGLDDLPIEVAFAIESQATQLNESEPVAVNETGENLVFRLEAIRERIWRLQAMFAVSLSQDCAIEANQYLSSFQALAARLKEQDSNAFDNLVRGHESLLLSPSVSVKQSIPIETQRQCELRWEIMRSPTHCIAERGTPSVPDGLGWML